MSHTAATMTAYAVGDIQGCYGVLRRLLRRLAFNAARDNLYSCGDMINRGPQSQETLAFLQALGPRCTAVLGNHELLFLAMAFGVTAPSPKDTLGPLLRAPNVTQYIDWLLDKPLVHVEDSWSLVHAGMLPFWSLAEAQRWSDEARVALSQNASATRLLRALFGREQLPPSAAIGPLVRAVQALTMMRVCRADGTMLLPFHQTPPQAPAGFAPWFTWPHRRGAAHTVVCGHWAALGLHRAAGVVALDSGCVWGRALSAIEVPDGAFQSEPAQAQDFMLTQQR